jgi:hypothetical protein
MGHAEALRKLATAATATAGSAVPQVGKLNQENCPDFSFDFDIRQRRQRGRSGEAKPSMRSQDSPWLGSRSPTKPAAMPE